MYGRGGASSADVITPFSDGCGVIEAVGPGVTKFKAGDRVATLFFQNWTSGPPTLEKLMSALGFPIPGAGAELQVFGQDGVSKVPEFLTDQQVATLPCAGLTAWRGLFEDARLEPGDTVVLQGTGGVSIFGLQFAKAAGYRTVITSSSDEKLARAKAMGADHLVNYKTTPAWSGPVREATGGRETQLGQFAPGRAVKTASGHGSAAALERVALVHPLAHGVAQLFLVVRKIEIHVLVSWNNCATPC
eukprot:gene59246-81119_t